MLQAAFLLMLLGGDPSRLDPRSFELHVLQGIESPTGMARVGNRIYVTGDYLSARPGLYVLFRDQEKGWQAGLLQIILQQGLEGVQALPEGLLLASSRLFDNKVKNWGNQVLVLGKDHQQLSRTPVAVDNRCSDGSFGCGMVAAVPDGPDAMWVVTRKSTATLYRVRRGDDQWAPGPSVRLSYNGRSPEISEMHRIGDKLVFLIKNRWALASCPVGQPFPVTGRLALEPYFDFSHLRKAVRTESHQQMTGGMAEGFTFDNEGNLLILLNNRGFRFRKTPGDQLTGTQPGLLIFTAAPAGKSSEPEGSERDQK